MEDSGRKAWEYFPKGTLARRFIGLDEPVSTQRDKYIITEGRFLTLPDLTAHNLAQQEIGRREGLEEAEAELEEMFATIREDTGKPFVHLSRAVQIAFRNAIRTLNERKPTDG